MNILVTGSCGYIGRVTIKNLAKEESINNIVGLDICEASEDLKSIASYTHFSFDIRSNDINKILETHQVDIIVHLASILNPPPHMTEKEVESIEIDGAQNILNFAKIGKVKKVIFTSSGAAYGYHSDNPKLIDESHRIKGSVHFPYSKHKAEIENIINKFSKSNPNIKTLILRPGTVLGKETKGPITDYFQKKVLIGIKDYPSPFCFIFDEDVCSAILQGCLNLELEGAYNLSGDGTLSLKEIANNLGTKYLELPRGLMKFAISFLKKLRLTQYSPYQVDFMCFRPVLNNEKLKKYFKDLPSKTSREVFEIYKQSRKSL